MFSLVRVPCHSRLERGREWSSSTPDFGRVGQRCRCQAGVQKQKIKDINNKFLSATKTNATAKTRGERVGPESPKTPKKGYITEKSLRSGEVCGDEFHAGNVFLVLGDCSADALAVRLDPVTDGDGRGKKQPRIDILRKIGIA